MHLFRGNQNARGIRTYCTMLFEVPGWKLGAPATERSKKKKKKVILENVKPVFPMKQGKHTAPINVPKPVAYERPKHQPNTFPEMAAPTSQKQPNTMLTQPSIPRGGKGAVSKAQQKLSGARFRHLNEKLYTCSSGEALEYFKTNPTDFFHYHTGFREQTKAWPINPVDIFIGRLEKMLAVAGPASSPKEHRHAVFTVVDMGCGEAKIANSFSERRPIISVKSFDLAAVNEYVEIASMTATPLGDGLADIVIFSLSLMNTDFNAALEEASRILKPNGQLWIAEVESRFSDGSRGVDEFCSALEAMGFCVTERDLSKRVFILLFATKRGTQSSRRTLNMNGRKSTKTKPVLKPCLYKKR